jgi:hypothetical protein
LQKSVTFELFTPAPLKYVLILCTKYLMDSERIKDPKTKSDFSNNKNIRSYRRVKKNTSMTLEFEEALKVLEGHIEVLKQNLLFLMAECKPEMETVNQRIITIKRELDKAIHERMKINQILLSS